MYFGDDNTGDDCVLNGGPAGGGALAPVEELRNPYTGQCVSNGGQPPPGMCGVQPGGTGGDVWFDYNWGVCHGGCDGLDEATCLASDGCQAAYADACGTGMCPEARKYAACWSVAQTGPIRGGDCSAIADAYECSQHDDCITVRALAADGTPGDFESCAAEGTMPPPPPPAAACDTLTDEATCIDRIDGCQTNADGTESCGDKCEPLYEGSNCTCDAAGHCTCTTWTFTACRVAH